MDRTSSFVIGLASTTQDNAEPPSPSPAPADASEDKVPFQSLRRLSSRRHSTQILAGTVYPIPEAPGETPIRSIATGRRRSISTRGIAGTPTSPSPPTWASGLRRSVSDIRGHIEVPNREPVNVPMETPYEEMMARFQIRQLQRTPSNMTLEMEKGNSTSRGFAAGFNNDNPATPVAGLTARTPRAPTRNFSDNASSAVGDFAPTRTASFLYFGEHSTFDATQSHPPFESGTSSAQLAEQLHLAQAGLQRNNGQPKYLTTSIWRRFYEWKWRLVRPLSPYSMVSQARYALILLVTVIYVLYHPMKLAFPRKNQRFPIDTTVGVLLGLDILTTLHTGYVTETGAIVHSHWLIVWHYLKTRFVLDLLILSSIIAHVNFPAGSEWTTLVIDVLTMERLTYIMHFIRMIWLIRANQSGGGNNLWAWLLYSRYSHLFRIAGIVAVVICITHYIACIWTLLLDEGDGVQDTEMPWHEQYASSFYAALLLMQGEGVSTNTAAQDMFASLSVVLGSIVLAVIFGHVAVLVADFNANTTGYQRKREEVYAMTAKLQLPVPLRERIREYYEHLWNEYECLDGEIVQFSKGLSHSLSLEVVLFKYMEVVMHVPFWKDCTPDFQKQLMLRLDVRVYLPNDFIMRQGEVDDEFYMVNRGYCEFDSEKSRFERVTTTTLPRNGFNIRRTNSGLTRRRSILSGEDHIDDGPRQSAYELDAAQRRFYRNRGRNGKGNEELISRGQAFGDMALLMNYQRAANVRAVTHVEMCVLSRDCFQALLTRYPEDRRKVIVDMLASYMQSYEESKSRCPLLELVRKVYSPEAIKMAGGLSSLLPAVLTVRQAAERIYTAINVDPTDATLKFGINVNIRDKLVNLRERRRQKRDVNVQNKMKSDETAAAPSSNRLHKSKSRQSTCTCACKHSTGTNGTSSDGKPLQHPTESPSAEVPAQTPPQPPLQERLRQLEERELAILEGLKELQTSFNLLRARQTTTSLPHLSRKRSAAGDDAAIKKPSGTPLLRKVGSFVGMPSSSRKMQGHTARKSPTRYADNLFNSQKPGPSSQPTEARRYYQERSRQQILSASKNSFRFTSEMEQQDSQIENVAVPSTAIGSGAIESTPSKTEVPIQPSMAPEPSRRQLFQRMTSQSVRALEGLAHSRTDSVPAAKVEPAVHTRRSTFQRTGTHSQSLRNLTDALSTLQAPRTLVPSTPSRALRRMSSFVAVGENASSGTKPRSPTRYADELFGRTSNESPKDEAWEYK